MTRKYNWKTGCDVEATLSVIGGRWKPILVCHLLGRAKAVRRAAAAHSERDGAHDHAPTPRAGGGWRHRAACLCRSAAARGVRGHGVRTIARADSHSHAGVGVARSKRGGSPRGREAGHPRTPLDFAAGHFSLDHDAGAGCSASSRPMSGVFLGREVCRAVPRFLLLFSSAARRL